MSTATVTARPIQSPWLRPHEAAAYLNIALGTIRNWTRVGRIPFVRRGRVVRYHRQRLDEWLLGEPPFGEEGSIDSNI